MSRKKNSLHYHMQYAYNGTMPDLEFKVNLSPTQAAYATSEAVIVAIISNTGEGKTYASAMALPIHAQRCGEPILAAIVRDTHENIKTSTARSIDKAFKDYPGMLHWSNDYKKLIIDSDPQVTVDLFGIDDPASLSKLQGPEYAIIWLEEPAPMADRSNAGLSEEVFNAALVRAVRQTVERHHGRLQVSMNPADEDHWTYRRLIEDPAVDPENPLITKAVFQVAYGENVHVPEISRQAVKAAYKNDPDSYARYVLGQFASVYRGVKVTPQYNRSRHLSPWNLEPAPGLVSFAFFDSWSNPSCVLGQITQYGRLVFLDTLRLEGADIATLLELEVIPLLESPRWKGKAKAWRVGGDCSMKNMDQSNKLESAARKVERAFPGCFFEAGPPQFELIKQHLPYVLRASDFRGEPMILLSKDNRILDKGLSGAWHYPTNNAGQRTGTLPKKDEASHPCDGFANAVCVLLPSKLTMVSKPKARAAAAKARRRAQSYGVGGPSRG